MQEQYTQYKYTWTYVMQNMISLVILKWKSSIKNVDLDIYNEKSCM